MTNYLLEHYKTSTCWQHTYGTVDFLNYLKLQKQHSCKNGTCESQFKLGVISNFDSRLDVLMRNMKLNHYFDFMISSYLVGVEKPDVEIFKAAMRMSELKDLKPNQCLHIGNTPITDYFGPRKAGWYSLLIHEKPAEKLREKYGDAIEQHHVYQNMIGNTFLWQKIVTFVILYPYNYYFRLAQGHFQWLYKVVICLNANLIQNLLMILVHFILFNK